MDEKTVRRRVTMPVSDGRKVYKPGESIELTERVARRAAGAGLVEGGDLEKLGIRNDPAKAPMPAAPGAGDP